MPNAAFEVLDKVNSPEEKKLYNDLVVGRNKNIEKRIQINQ